MLSPQVLRASLLFVWRNEKGETWRDVIRSSARSEFEAHRSAGQGACRLRGADVRAHRFSTDGEEVNRLLIMGRDCLEQTLEKVRRPAGRSATLLMCYAAVPGPETKDYRRRGEAQSTWHMIHYGGSSTQTCRKLSAWARRRYSKFSGALSGGVMPAMTTRAPSGSRRAAAMVLLAGAAWDEVETTPSSPRTLE